MYRKILAVTLTLGSVALAGSSTRSGNADATVEGKRLLRDMRVALLGVGTQANELEAARRNTPGLSKETYFEEMTLIGDGLNRAGRDLTTLEAEQQQLAPWEQEAVMKASSLIRDAEDNANSAVDLYNRLVNSIWSSTTYWDDVAKIHDDSQRAAATLGDFLKLNKAISDETRARQHLSEEPQAR